jgi:hypothetical protein
VPERFVTRAQPIDLSRPTAIQLHLGKLVAAGVAIRDIVGVTARHGGRLFALCGWSIPPEPDRYSKPARISPFPSGRAIANFITIGVNSTSILIAVLGTSDRQGHAAQG